MMQSWQICVQLMFERGLLLGARVLAARNKSFKLMKGQILYLYLRHQFCT